MSREDEIVEMAQRLIQLYQNNDGKKKGRFKLNLDQFKKIVRRKNLHPGLVYDIDKTLRKNGYVLITHEQKHSEAYAVMKEIAQEGS